MEYQDKFADYVVGISIAATTAIVGILAYKIPQVFKKALSDASKQSFSQGDLLSLSVACCTGSLFLLALIFLHLFVDGGQSSPPEPHILFKVCWVFDLLAAVWLCSIWSIAILRSAGPEVPLRLRVYAACALQLAGAALIEFVFFATVVVHSSIRLLVEKWHAAIILVVLLISCSISAVRVLKELSSGSMPKPFGLTKLDFEQGVSLCLLPAINLLFFVIWYARIPQAHLPSWCIWIILLVWPVLAITASRLVWIATGKLAGAQKIHGRLAAVLIFLLSITGSLMFSGFLTGRIPIARQPGNIVKDAHIQFPIKPGFTDLRSWVGDYYGLSDDNLAADRLTKSLISEWEDFWDKSRIELLLTQQRMTSLAFAIKIYNIRTGQIPQNIERVSELPEIGKIQFNAYREDAWGTLIRLDWNLDPTKCVLISGGPDRKFDTNDDIVSKIYTESSGTGE